MCTTPAPRCRWSRTSSAQIQEEGAYTERGGLVNSGEFDGMDYQGAFEALAARFEQPKATARAASTSACATGA